VARGTADDNGAMQMTQPAHILLVEDNASDVELALHALQRINIPVRVETVRDGAEALDFLFHAGSYAERKGKAPNLVLLDLKLPRVNGLEVLRQVKTDPRTRRIPVVVLTSSGEASDIAACYALGANSYIVKPVEFEKFCESIRQLGLYWLLVNEPA
jgi:CheY-like chemotaxis protein